MKSTERTTWWTNQNIWRVAVVFATAVVAIHVLLAVVGLKEGTSFFDRGVDPDSMFREHWLADLAAAQTNWSALGIGVLTLAAIAAMQLEVAGPWRPLLLAWGWAVCTFLTLVLPGNLSLYLVPMLLPLALYRVGWPEMSVIVLAGTGFVLGLVTLRYGRKTGGGCPVCGRRSPTAHPRRFARFATLAAYAAALAPLGYASVRLLWAAGVPAGTSAQFLQRINDANPGHGTVLMELTLAGMAMGGGVLC
ncbi:hypothetical protein ABN028_07950 [Actinopolymorpha sp. B17G11]|uniref:hypothetical protein n=1 Tax=unclassified Actinopolymorpha TaxID=2627063 RepID=UPI0032D90833